MNKSILFFYFLCYVCSRLALFVIKRSNTITLVSLQSEFAKEVLKSNYESLIVLNTLVLFENDDFYIKSTAVLRIVKKMSGLWPILGIFGFIPMLIRDKLYDVIAKNRLKWFKQKDNCELS